jgi:hypothetical protein
MSVKQFSAVYLPLEDRILFGFNTSENELYQFFLTRAVAKSFFLQAEQISEQAFGRQHNERSSKLISEFQKEGLKKQLNFQEQFEGGDTLPLGDDPILVTQVQLENQEDDVRVSLTLVTNQMVGFSLPALQLQAVCVLLEKLAQEALWQISADGVGHSESSSADLVSSSSALH